MMTSAATLRLAIAAIYFTAVALGATIEASQGNNTQAPDTEAPDSVGDTQSDRGPGLLLPPILLALKEGPAGIKHLLAWSSWAEGVVNSDRTPPPVWVICTDTTAAASVLRMPHVSPYVVSEESSWAAVIEDFLSQNLHIWGVGLLGEGALPHPGLIDSIESMQLALLEAASPTAILTRSRSKGSFLGGGERWLSDKFVSQLWCNRAVLEESMLAEAGLTALTAREVGFLQVLPRLIRDAAEKRLVLVDGTHVIGSLFDDAPRPPALVVAASGGSDYEKKASNYSSTPRFQDPEGMRMVMGGGGAEVYIGTLAVALVYDVGEDDVVARGNLQGMGEDAARTTKTSSIVKAPWPPEYILETVAMNATTATTATAAASKGLVLVSNVNCGYLDMATNFLMSVRNTSDAKVLFVAMDEVSFDFMDALDPGCAALFPSPTTARQHSVESGRIGDTNFAESVLVRPKLLHSILSQGYAVLWSDSDIVWLGNPLSLLPRLDDTEGADVMLQYDGNTGNKCTCFIFLKPTMMCRMLLKLWQKRIADSHKAINQGAFQEPLTFMRHAGLKVDFMPPEVMPAGKHFFDHVYQENYAQLQHNHTRIVHNNWIKGHDDKKKRFRNFHLWSVEDMPFPVCGNPSLDGSGGSATAFQHTMAGTGRLMAWTGVGVIFIMFVWYSSKTLRARRRRRFNARGV